MKVFLCFILLHHALCKETALSKGRTRRKLYDSEKALGRLERSIYGRSYGNQGYSGPDKYEQIGKMEEEGKEVWGEHPTGSSHQRRYHGRKRRTDRELNEDEEEGRTYEHRDYRRRRSPRTYRRSYHRERPYRSSRQQYNREDDMPEREYRREEPRAPRSHPREQSNRRPERTTFHTDAAPKQRQGVSSTRMLPSQESVKPVIPKPAGAVAKPVKQQKMLWVPNEFAESSVKIPADQATPCDCSHCSVTEMAGAAVAQSESVAVATPQGPIWPASDHGHPKRRTLQQIMQPLDVQDPAGTVLTMEGRFRESTVGQKQQGCPTCCHNSAGRKPGWSEPEASVANPKNGGGNKNVSPDRKQQPLSWHQKWRPDDGYRYEEP